MTGPQVVRVLERILIATVLLLGAWALWFLTGGPLRLLCGFAALAFSGCLVAFVFGRWRRALKVSGLAVAGLAMSPVEVSPVARPGFPHIVPVIAGLPGPEDFERASRGEVVLIGCIVSGFEPRWVVVW